MLLDEVDDACRVKQKEDWPKNRAWHPCGTPNRSRVGRERVFPERTYTQRLLRYDQSSTRPRMPQDT